MAVQILCRRSSVLRDRPLPIRLGSAELAINNNAGEPGLFFADNTSSPSTGLIKVGPTHVGSSAPNTSPAGYSSLSKGESWLDTASTHIYKIFDGSSWQISKAVVSNSAGYPANPVDGQLHYNTSTSKLAMYNLATTSWIVIGP
tara:strand:+ start:657 stop:1088 length:432 start_codon:yes stop_codon:yes gene_type:complete